MATSFKRSMFKRAAISGCLVLAVLGTVLKLIAAEPDMRTLGLPEVQNQAISITLEKIQLGRRLFFDARLSRDGKISCAACHDPDKVFSDGLTKAKGFGGQVGTRNTPSLLNAVFLPSQFWEGRRTTLGEQVLDPLLNAVEHGLASRDELVQILRRDATYGQDFQAAFRASNENISVQNVVTALVAFQTTLVAGNSPFDRYLYQGESKAMSLAAQRGLALFRSRAQCAECHHITKTYALFTDGKFHNVGVGNSAIASRLVIVALEAAKLDAETRFKRISTDAEIAQLGRFNVTLKPEDIGAFRTQSLRNVARTAPYMHDGSIKTLEEAVEQEIYYRSARNGRPIILTPNEKSDLVEFLRALDSEGK